ncbi:MAG: DEAD/DEAH box helicase, partial [Myxococcales bacterium]|nr:DEAD/DEAH box helicase [Myxococcales bacterium]
LRQTVADLLIAATPELTPFLQDGSEDPPLALGLRPALQWLQQSVGLGVAAAEQLVEYLATALVALRTMPTQQTLVLERFFDESGGMQLVIHSPHGARLNRAWGLALRKRFCRNFNFELQAAATEDAIVLSLGHTHSFPLDDVFHFLSANSVESILVQAMLDAPVFTTRWRWTTNISLAVLR